MSESKKYVRFIDSGYQTLFHVPDGGSIRVVSGYDGSVQDYPCRYIDEYHFEARNHVWHICQFAEFMERNGNQYMPVREIGVLDFYPKKYYDRENVGQDGKIVPYYDLIENVTDRNTSSEVAVNYGFCLNPSSADKTFCVTTRVLHPRDGQKAVTIKFGASVDEVCLDKNLCERINNIVDSIREQEAGKSVDELLRSAAVKAEQASAVHEHSRSAESLGFDV